MNRSGWQDQFAPLRLVVNESRFELRSKFKSDSAQLENSSSARVARWVDSESVGARVYKARAVARAQWPSRRPWTFNLKALNAGAQASGWNGRWAINDLELWVRTCQWGQPRLPLPRCQRDWVMSLKNVYRLALSPPCCFFLYFLPIPTTWRKCEDQGFWGQLAPLATLYNCCNRDHCPTCPCARPAHVGKSWTRAAVPLHSNLKQK